MKHIVIDARLYGPKHTGIGRYIQNLLHEFPHLKDFSKYRWTLVVYSELADQIKQELGEDYSYIIANFRHYSFKEQLLFPRLLHELHPDLVHIPHFNKPILYTGPTVVTIHDLIKHFSKGKETTTRNPIFYWPKYWAYRLTTQIVIKTNYLLVPSDYWRNFIIHHFGVSSERIITTHEAVDKSFFVKTKPSPESQSYILYTGNLYPHKNINIIFDSLQKIPDLHLKIISKPSKFLNRTRELVHRLNLDSRVEFLGFVDDQAFVSHYQHALAFVFPSLMEGFGLPGLEAQAMGCPVISSNSSCLPEVYGDSVLYFNPHSSSELVHQIVALQKSPSLRKDLINKGYRQVKKYSWSQTAAQTFSFYERILHR
ncbi:glycosyltransferase family 4 protein [Patescibacteria group bacterium]|nr:glycosyltransferase family 4 protein [Patescibacteria group bacterium]